MSAVNIISGDGGGVAGRCGERIQQCWQFDHPRRDLILDSIGESSLASILPLPPVNSHIESIGDRVLISGTPLTNSHNTRSSALTFHIPHAGPLHGLAGYFEAHLYANVGLSIHPETAHRVSPDMFSWFPIFFPFKDPLYLPSGSELDVSIWRLWDGSRRRIWYEWTAEAYLPTTAGGVAAPGPSAAGTGTASGAPGAGAWGTPGGPGERSSTGANLTPNSARSTIGPGNIPNSPMMDAPFSPGFPTASWGGGEGGRVKIGQTSLHNANGVHSWVGL